MRAADLSPVRSVVPGVSRSPTFTRCQAAFAFSRFSAVPKASTTFARSGAAAGAFANAITAQSAPARNMPPMPHRAVVFFIVVNPLLSSPSRPPRPVPVRAVENPQRAEDRYRLPFTSDAHLAEGFSLDAA